MVSLSDDALDGFMKAGIAWHPRPLRRDEQPFDYPEERLPGIIGQAVREVAEFTQAPVALIAASALSAVSAAVQTRFSVRRNARMHGPASLFFLTVAESGERKSSVDDLFMAPIRQWEAEQRQEEKRVQEKYAEELAEWERDECKGDRPEPPAPTPKMLRGDDTSEALLRHLARYPCAAVISAEAGVIFGSHSMKADSVQRNLGLANQLWDGGPVLEGRIGRGETTIESVRVTMGLMLQPSVLQSFLQTTNGMARGIGFFARFLFCHPQSTQGSRYYRDPPPMPALDKFQGRITLLLQWPAAQDDLGRLITHHIGMDDEAQNAWVMFYNEVEERIGTDGEYSGIKDVASKAAENAARLACCLHVFTDANAPQISRSTMDIACSLMRWYLDEAVRFGRQAEITEEMRNAEMLEEWLVQKFKEARRAKQEWEMRVNTIRQKCPNPLRTRQKLDAALELLQDHGRIRVISLSGSKSKYVQIAPQVVEEYC